MKKLLASLICLFALLGCTNESPRNSSYTLSAVTGNGSGTLVAPNIILTAAHVAVMAKYGLSVEYKGVKVPVSTKPIKIDEANDLALVQVLGVDCPCAPIAKSIKQDEEVTTIGTPLSLTEIATKGAYQGETSVNFAKGYSIYTSPIAPGNSGGGVFNSRGELVGVISMVPVIPMGFTATLALHLAMSPSLATIKNFLKGPLE